MYIILEDVGLFEMVKVLVWFECFDGGIDCFDWNICKCYEEFDFGYVMMVYKV